MVAYGDTFTSLKIKSNLEEIFVPFCNTRYAIYLPLLDYNFSKQRKLNLRLTCDMTKVKDLTPIPSPQPVPTQMKCMVNYDFFWGGGAFYKKRKAFAT